MATTQLCCFSEDGEYFAHSSSDGTLRIFECATATLKQEYSSSSHLSSTTSSLTWSRLKKELPPSPNAKRKKLNNTAEEESYHDELKLLALGTTSGTVYLYSFAKGLLHTQLTGAHTSAVNDICWHFSKPELFTCSEDQTVVQWDLKKGKVRHKWKCDNSGIYSVCLCSQNKLLTASNSIKLWDLNTRTVLQTFTGHSSPIFTLIPVWSSTNEASYVLSASLDDRHIQIWYCGDSSKDRDAVASFSVPDEPVYLSLCKPSTSSQNVMLSVITRKGFAYIFEHVLNGKKSTPMTSKVTVKAVMSNEQADVKKSSVPILASDFITKNIIVAYGNPVKPQFERIKYDAAKPEIIITVKALSLSLIKEEYSQLSPHEKAWINRKRKERKQQANSPLNVISAEVGESLDTGFQTPVAKRKAVSRALMKLPRSPKKYAAVFDGLTQICSPRKIVQHQSNLEDSLDVCPICSNSKVKKPEVSKHMTTLLSADSQPIPASKTKGKKRIRRTSVSDLTVEERLAAMSTDTPKESQVKQQPVANTLCRLLQQALLSGDHKLLTGVFQETNETIVRNTLKRLPVSCIVPLVKVIEAGMMGHAQHAWNLSRWTSCLISCHSSYILSVPEIITTMNKLYQTLISRQKFFPKMLQLKGRLDLVKQGGSSKEVDDEDDASKEPLLVYQDESDSDESEGLAIDGAAEESDENWDDIESDMES
ncbi:WD repeat-containing protein 43 [Biomphalaria pfeifferi]|uniref:WD repeat-containing protein 43 n=1 Tax=Biomphalaria pfeifferi TaxID=112525 RepID=A0AAD8BNJ3_BIOPF|nr:WD repeat-containing protein 43 [Biomphalaria pfeifferi]